MSAPYPTTPIHYWRAMRGIVGREMWRFVTQRERFISALVRPLVWLFVFAAGFRASLGMASYVCGVGQTF